jgi:hypothetical protein
MMDDDGPLYTQMISSIKQTIRGDILFLQRSVFYGMHQCQRQTITQQWNDAQYPGGGRDILGSSPNEDRPLLVRLPLLGNKSPGEQITRKRLTFMFIADSSFPVPFRLR